MMVQKIKSSRALLSDITWLAKDLKSRESQGG